MDIQRRLNLKELLRKKSHFLLGPRSTGKSTLIRQQLPEACLIDLLQSRLERRLTTHPEDLETLIGDHLKASLKDLIVVIDEIQKVPALLNEVHRLIEEKKIRFLLTGSSARKLKGDKANLLAGRAWRAELFPMTWKELEGVRFDLDRYLHYGGLPSVYLSDHPQNELDAYVHTYLYEEIRAEAMVRKIPAFSRFLEAAALANGQMINFSEIAKDCEVNPATIREYYAVLEDTLMGFTLPPWTKSKKRKAIQTAKFYFFDVGVVHALDGTESLDRNSDLYGRSFEHFIAMELRAYLSYAGSKNALSYWRSVHDQEVDFVLGDKVAIEVKSSRQISDKHFNGLKALQEEKIVRSFYLITQDPLPAKRYGIHCLPWTLFLKKLWAGELM